MSAGPPTKRLRQLDLFQLLKKQGMFHIAYNIA